MTILTILCMTLTAYGHINATLGLAYALRKRGHRVVFITERSFQGYFEKQGFEEEIFDEKEPSEEVDKAKEWREWASKNLQHVGKPFIENYEIIYNAMIKILNDTIYENKRVHEIVQKVQPNIIIEDRLLMPMPAFVSSRVPIVKLASFHSLYQLQCDELPTPFFQLPTDDKSEWQKCRKVTNEARDKAWLLYKDYVKSLMHENGYKYEEILSLDPHREYMSTNLTILMYPEALIEDYLKLRPLTPNYMILDHSIRESSDTFELPEKLKTGGGKLIYFSMGTIATAITDLTQKLLDIFGKTNHRFIASLGEMTPLYTLPENVWGASHVPQLKVLELVDLVLTHGGNNTFVESLYHAKPMIVFPMFADQFDNAQRAKEMNVGLTFNPFTVTESELITSMDLLLNDKQVSERVTAISKQMQNSDSMEKVVNKIEFVAENPEFPTVK